MGWAAALPVFVWALRHPSNLLVNGHAYSQEAFLLVAVMFSLLLIYLSPLDDWIADNRALRPVASCGRICYSLYLTHLPITFAIAHALYYSGYRSADDVLLYSVPSGLVASILVAWPFHLWFERPFLNTPSG